MANANGGQLMRRRDVCRELGICGTMLRKLVECHVVRLVHLVPGGRAHYMRADVDNILLREEQQKRGKGVGR